MKPASSPVPRHSRFAAALLLAVAAALPLRAAPADLAADARRGLDRARTFLDSIATHGGFLWRYSPDLKERAGEREATDTQIWIQPPGTPAMGTVFLDAYRATGDAAFLESARRAAEALAVGQLESGGWDYVIEFDPAKARAWHLRTDAGKVSPADAAKRKNISTYDDNTSQSATRYLLAFCDATKDSADPRDRAIREARDYALRKLIESQYPNGAWPQRWDGVARDAKDYPVLPARYPDDYPRVHPGEKYFAHYTFNDGAQRDLVLLMLDAWHKTGRDEFRAAAVRGGEFMLLSQMPAPQPGWAQQYNARMEPAWARAFEPPAIASGETVGVLRALLELHIETGEARFLKPIAPAMEWLKRSAIGEGRWARYYELQTNKPIYGDRDGKIYHRLQDISEERQKGYGWEGDFGVASFRRALEKFEKEGREKILRSREPKPRPANEKESRLKALEPKVRQILAAQDAQGRWIKAGKVKKASVGDDGYLDTGLFIENLRALAEYVEMAR
jgi:PelA/Pel-15E family pectate lyase